METQLDNKRTMSEAQIRASSAQIELLTAELVKARSEVASMQKKLKRIEEDTKCREQQLMKMQEEELLDLEDSKGCQNKFNGNHPFDIFPEEIWLMIFGYLKDSKTLKSCYEAFPMFSRLWLDKRNEIHFYDVLKVMTDPVKGLRFLPPRELTSVLKSCRLVCKVWKDSVEELLQQDCPIIPQVQNKMTSSSYTVFSFTRNPWNDDGLRSLNVEINPIPSRYVVYQENGDCSCFEKRKEDLQRSLDAFLEKFGHQVWFFKATYSPVGMDPSWYTYLLHWLSLMPNLKSLFIERPMGKWWTTDKLREKRDDEFSIYYCGMACLDNNDGPPAPPIDQVNALKEAALWYPAPTIKLLKTVVFEDCPQVVVEEILNSNPQVEWLKMKRNPLNQATVNLSLCKVEQLKEVWISLPLLKDNNMDGLDGVTWATLKKLHLEAPFVDWNALFEALEKRLGNILEELELTLRGPYPSDFLRLGLPNLKVLNLTLKRHFKSIDFILQLEKLEQLTVDFTHMYQYEYEKKSPIGSVGSSNGYDYKPISEIPEIIKIHQYTHNLKDSNIWSLFPNLKKVKARTDRKFGCDVSTPTVDYSWQTCTRRLED